jgi:hypothetical protein
MYTSAWPSSVKKRRWPTTRECFEGEACAAAVVWGYAQRESVRKLERTAWLAAGGSLAGAGELAVVGEVAAVAPREIPGASAAHAAASATAEEQRAIRRRAVGLILVTKSDIGHRP